MPTLNFGPGVSRALPAQARNFLNVIFQANMPPNDSEFNLQDSIHNEQVASLIRSQIPSGFLLDPTATSLDFVTDPLSSNGFRIGRAASDESDTVPILWANVNGWLIPLTGTESDGTDCLVKLYPPPESDTRTDMVFLEVWQSLLAPNPSTDNKPSASTVYSYGNTEYGQTNQTDDLEDPTLLFETTKRVQLQYRLRVHGQGAGAGASVALDVHPDGLGDTNILGQGTATSPVAGLIFTNCRTTLGDSGLWRAGDGDTDNDLGTVDGYTYAIPVCAVFRRNSSPFVFSDQQNGSLDRNGQASLLSDPREGFRIYTAPTLTADISKSAVGLISLTGISTSPLSDTEIDLASTFLKVGNELIGPLTAVGVADITIPAGSRGRGQTQASPHSAGDTVSLYCPRPDGLFSDQIAAQDIYDLRKTVSFTEADPQKILSANFRALVTGTLNSCYKQSYSTQTNGTHVVEVSYMLADGGTAVPAGTQAVDGPDGIRTVWSDAATIQPDVTVLCDSNQPAGTVVSFDAGVSWDVGADFQPRGFLTDAGVANGSSLFLFIGGSDGSSGARGTFRDGGTKAVRFLGPQEYWKTNLTDSTTGRQEPVTVRWVDQDPLRPNAYGESDTRPGPLAPTQATNFEAPYIVLGGILNAASAVASASVFDMVGLPEIQLVGLDFDAAGGWWNGTDVTAAATTSITNTVLVGQKTLYSMLTRDGQDLSGRSSEVYVVLTGDTTNPLNNGAFQVIGAGTVGYTGVNATALDRVRVRPLSAGFAAFVDNTGLVATIRSQYTNAQDDTGGSAAGNSSAALAVVFTDIEGTVPNSPWAGLLTMPLTGKMVVNTTLQYHPGRAAMPRIPEATWRVTAVGAGTEYLHQAVSTVDGTFPGLTGQASGETYFQHSSVQTWNRLAGKGLSAPNLPATGMGGKIVSYSEQDRDGEVFMDYGSKSMILRPYLSRNMTLYRYTSGASLLGIATYPGPIPPALTAKDGAGIWSVGLTVAFEVPPEYMPRFGRQDIPYHTGTGAVFMPGINHLFLDSPTTSATVFGIIGGQSNGGVPGVTPLFVQTGATSGLMFGQYSTIAGPATPAYQGRLYESTEIISSDMGRGMRGIQLPPYLGVSRLMAVYDRRDYIAQGGASFESDRRTPAALSATNLLRTDQTKQTLFILQDGAQDVTGQTGDHTYVIPENALNIQLSPQYVTGEVFDDLEYVVVFTAFGFAKDWINGNNYVMARKFDGTGATPGLELAPCGMVIPAAAPSNDSFYVGMTRVPYQGDSYMTRDGSTRNALDYTERYGQVQIADAFKLASAIEQFDIATGTLIPETPNRRAMQVLASVDFYSTMGTGKMAGMVYPGTMTDVGYVSSGTSRVPDASTDALWRTEPRVFSEGQKNQFNFASLAVEIVTVTGLATKTITIKIPDQSPVVLTAGASFSVTASVTSTATNLTTAINAHAVLSQFVVASSVGTSLVTITALASGLAGNRIFAVTSDYTKIKLRGRPNTRGGTVPVNFTSAYLFGGIDSNVNGGSGESTVTLTGMTERLPLGILVQDSDFLCESPECDSSSGFLAVPSRMQPQQTDLPLSAAGTEYNRLTGDAGEWLSMSDGSVLVYEAYNSISSPTGTKSFRLYRGGGSAMVLTQPVAGGPVDWSVGSLPEGSVLKGAVLTGKALLVRNFAESAFSPSADTSMGDELHMVILTNAVYGLGSSGTDHSIPLTGIISPTGYGEGYAAADRYRLAGHPIVQARTRDIPDTDVDPAIYPGGTGTSTTIC